MRKIVLNNLFKSNLNQKSFILETALVFRLNLDSLFLLYDIDQIFNVSTKEELYKKMLTDYYMIDYSLKYLFSNDNTDQNIAINNFINYYNKLMIALKMHNETYKEYLDMLSDHEINDVQRKETFELTDNDYLTILNYQLKYAIPTRMIEKEFDIYRTTYTRRINKLLEQNPILQEKYQNLMNYDIDLYKSH